MTGDYEALADIRAELSALNHAFHYQLMPEIRRHNELLEEIALLLKQVMTDGRVKVET